MKLRILHVVPTYLPATRYGGPIYSVHGLCRGLAARGHETHVYTTDVDGSGVSDVPLAVPVERDAVRVTYFPTGRGRRLYRSPTMGQRLKADVATFDIVHVHSVFLWPTSAAALQARRANVPYVVSPRGMLVADLIAKKSSLLKRAWIEAFERRNIAEASAVHVTAEIEAEEIRRLGMKVRRVAVIPNGTDFPGPSQFERALETPDPVVVFLGRLNWKKGLDRLIPAMVKVPNAKLIIAGNDEENYRPVLEELARTCGVADRTTFVGPLHGADKWSLLASADVLALTSYSENFGIVVLEAMAAGVPVLVTPEVGLASTVAEAGCGVVVEGNIDKIGAALEALLADPQGRLRMCDAGRRVARERFSWGGVAEATEALYHSLVRPGETQTKAILGSVKRV